MTTISAEQLAEILHHSADIVDREVAGVVKRTAGRIADTQRENVHKRSHRTEKSIKATGPGGQPFGPTTIEAEIGPTWFVGNLLEHGTSITAPHPFVSTSADPHMAQHLKETADAATIGALKALI